MKAKFSVNRANTAAAASVLLALAGPALAQSGPDANGVPANSLTSNRPVDANRKTLADKGVTYGLNYEGGSQTVTSGGIKRGGIYSGRLEGFLDVDLEKNAGLKGLSFHTNVFNIHGNSLTPNYVGGLMTTSFIEAKTTTRLSELWLEQKLFGGMAAIRAGQLALDTEFFTSGYAAQFTNATFGWPALAGSNLPSGGPAYPFATPGARLKIDPNANLSLLVAIYNGDPAGPGTGDPQARNKFGLNFRLSDSPLLITEAQYRVNQDKGTTGLAGSYKIGAFQHTGNFSDQQSGTDGRSLSDPASNGKPAQRRGDSGVYAVLDQQIYRPASGEPDKGIGLFVRGMASPSDRNLVDTYVDGGVVFAGLWSPRPDDILSFGAAYARISSGARGLDADALRFNGTGLVRSAERLLEANYQAQIMAGWQMDFDVQRIMSPGGGAGLNGSTTTAIPSATVFTLHNSFRY